MSDDVVNIEVNGEPVVARKGQMIIEATDASDNYVPRFCYHTKLSVAANCRMCLVEVEKAPKPLPACATPVAEGMKIHTRSARAVSAQKATMEFLLINHPLDCPICDQGGECELQDLAMGYGRDISRYAESKRVVKDKNLGPLVSTDMTRCIHCTRCVRFGEEIAGTQELGTMGRGENMEISTFVEKSVDHELSGNIIDLCPVGALNSKPFRFRARSWEMTQAPLVSPHDCVGSNMYGHVHRGKLLRVVPRENEQINETWLADRDRFGYAGVYDEQRVSLPMVKRDDQLQEAAWEDALEAAASVLRESADLRADSVGVLASPSSTVEELYLLQKIMRSLGIHNIDHRLRNGDFRSQDAAPLYPSLGTSIAELENLQACLVLGSNVRREAPIIAHRLRKLARAGGQITCVNPTGFEYTFSMHRYLEASASQFVSQLAALVNAAASITGKAVPGAVQAACDNVNADADAQSVARSLIDASGSAIVIGALFTRHPAYSDLRALSDALGELTGATVGELSEGANAAGACIAGVLPHRGLAASSTEVGLNAQQMLTDPRETYVLLNTEPESDSLWAEQALAALKSARQVIVISPYLSDAAREYADVVLPIGTFAETDGTYVNIEGRWQSFAQAAHGVGESRPGWKVLRVLGNTLGLEGFDYMSAQSVLGDVEIAFADARKVGGNGAHHQFADVPQAVVVDVPMYAIDPLVRRSEPLQQTRDGQATAATY